MILIKSSNARSQYSSYMYPLCLHFTFRAIALNLTRNMEMKRGVMAPCCLFALKFFSSFPLLKDVVKMVSS